MSESVLITAEFLRHLVLSQKHMELKEAEGKLLESHRKVVDDVVLPGLKEAAQRGKYSGSAYISEELLGPQPWFCLMIRLRLETVGFTGISFHTNQPTRGVTVQASWDP